MLFPIISPEEAHEGPIIVSSMVVSQLIRRIWRECFKYNVPLMFPAVK